MKKYIHNFIHCGILGWCIEIVYTAVCGLRRRQFSLKGNTSVWMFPIYGLGCLILPISKMLKNRSLLFRGSFYASLIYAVEYLSGRILQKKAICPWDYSRSKWNIGSVIRLDFLPFWFATGLLFERLVLENEPCECDKKQA